MPKNVKRYYDRGDFHFIFIREREALDTFCCYQRRALLGSPRMRDLAVRILKEVRARCGFLLIG